MNIVIPMAGAGIRFKDHGFSLPKPLIKINDTSMIKVVIDNLKPKRTHRFIFLCQTDHINKFGLEVKLKQWAPNSIIIKVDGLTNGAAITVLKSKDFINNYQPLMIANCDQYIDFDINRYLDYMSDSDRDGLIMTMTSTDPKWSYVKLDSNGIVTNLVEKVVISNEATVGIYNYKFGKEFVDAAEEMVSNEIKTNGEFYVAPAYNGMIKNGKKIGIMNIGTEGVGMHGLGTPEDYFRFLKHPISSRLKVDNPR